MIIKHWSILFRIFSGLEKLKLSRHLDRDWTLGLTQQWLSYHDFDVVKEMTTDFVFLKGHEMNRYFPMRHHNMQPS